MYHPAFVSPRTGRQVKAVVFDTFGTVVDWRTGIARQVDTFAVAHGLALQGLDFADRWRGRYYPSMAKIRSGQRDYVPLDILHLENLIDALRLSGIDPGCLEESGLTKLNRAWEQLPPWEDSVAGLVRLKSGYIVGPLSNGNTALLVNMAKNAGLPWDVVIGLDQLRTYKPDPQAYLGAAHLLRLDPGEVMMAAAHNYDLEAAREAGLATAFIRRPTEHGQHQRTDLTAESDWDISVESIQQLGEVLVPTV